MLTNIICWTLCLFGNVVLSDSPQALALAARRH